MSFSKKIFIILFVSTLCIGCDQATKSLAGNYLSKSEMHTYFYDTFRLGYTENTGVFLGFGSDFSEDVRYWAFIVLVALFLAGLFFYMLYDHKLDSISIFAFSLVFGGGLSNLYDRIVNNGAVIDFLNFGFGSVRTGIFNVADMAIMSGLFIVLISQFRKT